MRHFLRPAAAAALAALFLTGCSTLPNPFGNAEHARPKDEAAQFAPVNYRDVCLLENGAVRSAKLVDAIEAGLKRSAKNVRRLPAGTAPGACPFVITYGVEAEKGVIRSIEFQTFEHGIPRNTARGRAGEGRGLTVDRVVSFMGELLDQLESRRKAGTQPTK